MDTTRVDIAYRPMRIAWAFDSADRNAFREAIRLNYAFWGGCYNPLVMIDKPSHAKQVIDLYRADFIVPVGESDVVKSFPKYFPHLINPFFPETLFFNDRRVGAQARILDIQNMLYHWRENAELKGLSDIGIRTFSWSSDDPLADTFLMQRGEYPSEASTGINYYAQLSEYAFTPQLTLRKESAIPLEWVNTPSLHHLHRLGLRRHHTVRTGWDGGGLFLGDASDIDDLVCFWNLRAADLDLQFVDVNHRDRYSRIVPEYLKHAFNLAFSHPHDNRLIGVWSRRDVDESTTKAIGIDRSRIFHVFDQYAWSGSTIRPPMMCFGVSSALGVVSPPSDNKLRVAFSLMEKPFSSDIWFHSQHLVASVTLFSTDEDNIFQPPYVPEWNEFLSRRMHWQYNKLRVEPARVGLVISVDDNDTSINSIPAQDIVIKSFEEAGFKAELSGGGLITRQLIARLGGLQGARVFKISGVRRLLKTFGPRSSFTKRAALAIIGGKSPEASESSFADHKQLYIEAREYGTDLTPPIVFSYLVAKGLIRIGADLKCPTCNLSSWISLDALRQRNVCELCGNEYDATRQLVDESFQYRRSGVLGLERNTQGAVPVALLLQQLQVNLDTIGKKSIFAPSFDLKPAQDSSLPVCEIDFVVITPGIYPARTSIIIGECKDSGGSIDLKDAENLRRVADALSLGRFEAYIAFVKLAPFTGDEIALLRKINGPYSERVIMLTARELEHYNIYDKTNRELGLKLRAWSAAELARNTSAIYFTSGET